jgi:hypothetical protein
VVGSCVIHLAVIKCNFVEFGVALEDADVVPTCRGKWWWNGPKSIKFHAGKSVAQGHAK